MDLVRNFWTWNKTLSFHTEERFAQLQILEWVIWFWCLWFNEVIFVTKLTERHQTVFLLSIFIKKIVLIDHNVFNVKFAFTFKCFFTFLGYIVNYVLWTATEIYGTITSNDFYFYWVFYAYICGRITSHMSKKRLTIFPDLTL